MMTKVKTNFFYLMVMIASVGFITSCTDDLGTDDCTLVCDADQVLTTNCTCEDINPSNEETVTANITENTTWTSDKVWILAGRIAVEAGATLTIEPGTIIKGQAGAEANATALLIARGARIMAEGTAASPIIFTSVADEIEPGMIQSPNLPVDISGLWGGVIILGNAPISADAASQQIEGIPASDQNGLYGGTDPNDDSGVFTYVSIRHGGTDIGEGNEINGLTLGGVGNGTTINHIEILSTVDDGIEPFGGSVDVDDILVWNQGDDAYDCDQAYTGMIDNFIYIGGPNSDHGLELDGPEGSSTGSFALVNGSLKGWNDGGQGGGEYADLRDGVSCTLSGLYFFNFSEDSDFTLSDDTDANYLSGSINLMALAFNTSHLTAGNTTIESIFLDGGSDNMDAFTTNPVDASIVTSKTFGANVDEFTGWTLADAEGELADF